MSFILRGQLAGILGAKKYEYLTTLYLGTLELKLVYLVKIQYARPRPSSREEGGSRQRRAKRLRAEEAKAEDDEEKKKKERRLDSMCR